MAQTELIDDHVSAKQCQLAIDALLKHEQRRHEKLQESQLLPGKEQNVWLVLTVKQLHPEKKLKPHKIPIVHPLVDPRTSGVCLITKDPQREYKDLLEEHKIKFVSRVVGLEKLKGKWKPFEARRLLLKENDLFLADERVVPLLPKLLGKKFFEAKKQPIPVNLTRNDLKGELERAISSTYFHQNQGTCSSIKIGTLSQTPAQVLANLTTALPAVAKAIKGGWDNIQSLNIKTNTSASLPIWSCDLGVEEGGRWAGLVDVGMDEDAEEAEASEESEPEIEKKMTRSEKGKKRAAEDDEPAEQPKKKTKATKEVVSIEQPKKRRKGAPTEAGAASEASSSAEKPSSSEELVSKKKKRRSPEPAIVAEPPAPEPASSDSSKSKGSAAPLTSKATKKQKSRAQATDFFDDAEKTPASAKIAPPPNTPASGLIPSSASAPTATTQTPANPKKKRKNTGVVDIVQTPVSHAIEKLAETDEANAAALPASDAGPAKDGDGTKPAKKARHKKNKAADGADTAAGATAAKVTEQRSSSQTPAAAGVIIANAEQGDALVDGEKKKKKRKKGSKQGEEGGVAASADVAALSADAAPAASVTVSEVKQKLGATSGVEKKKEKAVKAKRSAKDAVLGKKVL